MNILFLADRIDFVSGVTKHLFYLTYELVKRNDDKIRFICAGGDMKEGFLKSGINIIEYPRISFDNRSAMNFLLSLLYLIRFCKKNKISIIHSHTHYTANLGYFTSKIMRIRSVQTIHGLIPEEGRLPHFRADIYIALNDKIIKYLTHSGIKPEKIFLVHQGVPQNYHPVKKQLPLKVLCASRLTYDKGIDLFINSVSKIMQQLNTEAEFIVAGEGEYENDLKVLADKKKVNIKFLGKLENLNLALAESHIFIFPSRIKTEGFPVVLIEAGMKSNLVITSNFESLTEIAEPARDCLVFYNDDYEDLADKLLCAINNYGNMTIIAENWRNKCIQNYTSKIMAGKTREVYVRVRSKV